MPAEWSLPHQIAGLGSTRPIENPIAQLAAFQHGVVAREQLQLLGLARGAIEARIKTGRLIRVHRGVYAVGHKRLSRRGVWMAAVLAAGPDAVLSHRTAAALWGLAPETNGPIDVTAPNQRRVKGVRVHRCSPAMDETTREDGIPVSTLSRTLFDCAGALPAYRLEKLLQEAEFKRLTDTLSLGDLIARYPGHRGVARARMVLERGRFGASITKEEMEIRFLKLVDDYELPSPVLNGLIRAGDRDYEADCHWPNSMLVVELDSRSAHLTTYSFENDRARDRALRVAGWNVIRITWRQLHDEPARIAADIRSLLAGATA